MLADSFHVIGPAHRNGSFPSGHSTAIFTLLGVMVLTSAVGWLRWPLLVFAILVAVSRSVVGVHWPLDLLGGMLGGWLAALGGVWLARRWRWEKKPLVRWLSAAIPATAATMLLFGYKTGYAEAAMLQQAVGAVCLALWVLGWKKATARSKTKCNIFGRKCCMGKIYKQLGIEERTMIQTQLEMGIKPAAIALGLNRSASTLSRELRRNGWARPKARRGPGRPAVAGGYRAEAAHKRAQACTVKPRIDRRLRLGTALWDQVIHYLKVGYSPEQIAGTLALVNAETPTLQVSHETIYTAIYAMPRGELRTEVVGWLRFGHAKRRPRARGEDRRGRIPDMVSIHDRPPEVEERLVPGHWEGDLIKGAHNRSSVGTLVERTTLFTVLSRMDNASAEAALSGFSHVLNRIEAQKRLSLTYDQGREMAAHQRLTEATGVKVYFADPHSPWQRGINENTNGLLRQYLPKGSDLSGFTQDELDAIAWKLNTRPRKSLAFRCPAELFTPDAFDFRQHHAALFALGH